MEDTLSDAQGRGVLRLGSHYGTKAPGTLQNLLDLVGGDTIVRSARSLGDFMSRVRTATGAPQVDVVGHSQGALVAR